MEGFWSSRGLTFGKEPVIVARLNARRRRAFATAGVQALARWDNRQVRRHHFGVAQLMLFHAMAPAVMAATAKVFRRDAGNRSANVRIGERQIGIGVIRLPSAHRQRGNKFAMAVHVDHVDVGDADYVYAIEAASVPRIKRVMWPHGEPSNGTKAEAGVMSKADEENKCGRPQRTITNVDRSRPPAPGAAVIKPASIVIRGPAPRRIRDPGPSVIWFPHPPSRLIWGPRGFLIRLPNVAIARDVNPMSVSIQIIRAGVIAIRMSPARGIADYIVTIFVPAVPVIVFGRAADFIFRLVGAADNNHFARLDARAALRRGNFGFAIAHNHICLRV